ncbi:MAG: hypothetical protein MJ252_13045, partial [archaeon]|nr:hypothetical protein [archaeon]
MIALKMHKLLKLFLFFSFLVSLVSPRDKPSRDSFKSLDYGNFEELSLSTLGGAYGEAYFTISASMLYNEVTFILSQRSPSAVDLYYYTGYNDIKFSGDDYSGYKTKCTWQNSKECLAERGYNRGTHYIVIKLMDTETVLKASLLAYQKGSEINLPINEIFEFEKVYDKSLAFNFQLDENKDYQVSVILSKAVYRISVDSDNTDNKAEKFKTVNTQGKHTITITAITDEVSGMVLVEKVPESASSALQINLGEEKTILIREDKTVNVAVELTNFAYLEEGLVTFHFSKDNIYLTDKFKRINARIIEVQAGESIPEELYFPVKDNEAEFTPETVGSSEVHLHYYNKYQNENKVSYLIYSFSSKPGPDKITFNMGVAAKMEEINLSGSSENEFIFNIERKDYLPVVKKFILTKEDINSYVFYFSQNENFKYYEGNFFVEDTLNTKSHLQKIFSFSNKQSANITSITVQFHGEAKSIWFKVKKYSFLINYEAERTERSKEYNFNKDWYEYYYIQSSTDTNAAYLFLEEVYGLCELYYKGEVTKQTEEIFPTTPLGRNFITLGYSDIINIKCKFPARFYLHLFGNNNLEFTQSNSKKWIYLKNGVQGCFDIKFKLTEGNLEGFSTSTQRTEIKKGATSIANITNQSATQIGVGLDNGNKLCLTSSEDSVASISVTDRISSYTVLQLGREYSNVDYKYILYYLPNAQNYSEIRLNLINFNNEYKYGIVKEKCTLTNCSPYVPFVSNSQIENSISNDDKLFTIPNPYDKKGSDTSYKYYIAFELTNKEGQEFINYDISLIEMDRPNYNILTEGEVGIIMEETSSNMINQYIELTQTDNYLDKYIIVAKKTNPKFMQYIYQYNFYQQYFKGDLNENNLNIFTLNNLGVDTQLTGYFSNTTKEDYDCIEVSYRILHNGETFNESAITQYDSIVLDVYQSEDGQKFTWTKIDKADKYFIFITRKGIITKEQASDECYLDSVYQQYIIDGILPDGFRLINTVTDPEQIYDAKEEVYVTVIGEIKEENVKFRVPFPVKLFKDTDPLIPEESFVKMNILINHELNLTEEINETYFTFENKHPESDTVLKFINPNMNGVDMYIFDDLFDIQRPARGEAPYEGQIELITLENKEEIILNNITTQERLYFVLVNKNNVPHDSIIYYFNELDELPIEAVNEWTLDHFYSYSELSFTFSSSPELIKEFY